MQAYDLLLLGASAWMLFKGYNFLGDKDRAWREYVTRQKESGADPKTIERTPEWERNVMIQGIIYTGLGTFGLLVALFS